MNKATRSKMAPKVDLQVLLDSIKKNGELITNSEKSLGDKIKGLETKYDNALREQEERHQQEMKELREELDSLRQLIEGRSENVKLSNHAVESAVKEVATLEYKKLEKRVVIASEKANSNEQYARNWCLRMYGVVIPDGEVTKLGHTRAASEAVYNAVISPILLSLVNKGECNFTKVPDVGDIIENCHAVGKEVKKDGVVLPPPIIVRFLKREIRDLIIKNRKLLPKENEAPKFKVVEDLTPTNYARLIALIKDKRVDKAWSIQGKFRLTLAKDPAKKVVYCQGSHVDVDELVKSFKD